jgi:hypothetical protein
VTRDEAEARSRAAIRGMAIALAEVDAISRQPSVTGEVLASWGITHARQLRAAGVEDFDLRQLREALKESRRRSLGAGTMGAKS